MQKPSISVVIINWNSVNYLQKCLTTLYAQCRSISFEVIVVDGASYDGCAEMLQNEFPQVIFIQSPENIGFARGNNLGSKSALADTLLFLNPDTELLEDSLAAMHQRLHSLPNAGAVGCKLLNTDKSLQTSCIQSFPTVLNQVLDSDFLREKFPASRLWGTAAFYSPENAPAIVEGISGACIMIKRAVFEQIGGFTESYFMYGEDLDLGFKVRRSGHLAYYVSETSIVHHGGGSSRQAKSNFSTIMMRESVYRFMQFNRGWMSASAYRVSMATSAILRLLLIAPLLLIPGDKIVRHGSGSLRKWKAIFRWSLGLEPVK